MSLGSKQTHESLKRYLLEESYELLDAIDRQDDDNMIEELGDVLLQVLLHAQIGEDEGMFSIDDVIRSVSEKMVRRHPHVFGEVSVNDADEVLKIGMKSKRRKRRGAFFSVSFCTWGYAFFNESARIPKQAAKVGFDWSEVEPMWEKVQEELAEFQDEVQHADKEK